MTGSVIAEFKQILQIQIGRDVCNQFNNSINTLKKEEK